jgi:phosphate transport system permease protein
MTDSEIILTSLKKRGRAEKRFKAYGLASILAALGFLALLLFAITIHGANAFKQTEVRFDIDISQEYVDPENPAAGDYGGLLKKTLRETFPTVRKRRDKRKLYGLLSLGAEFELRDHVVENPDSIGRNLTLWLTASDDVDLVMKGAIDLNLPASDRRVDDQELSWIAAFEEAGAIRTDFSWRLFTMGDSREPEIAGVLGAMVGSVLTLFVCFVLSFPLGVAAAIYLEEFAPKNRWSALIEVNINNLAAVPSIIFGLLGLAIFLNVMQLPRSSPLVGGMVLALMTLPTIIIAARASLKAVPPSIRQAAQGLGASDVQTIAHHVLPLSMPGILTGTIIGMARALGETAPLLMIGMVAFIVDVPGGILEPATALPVQIFLWADSPERAFSERTAAAVLILLVFLIAMNLLAIILRKKFERRW